MSLCLRIYYHSYICVPHIIYMLYEHFLFLYPPYIRFQSFSLLRQPSHLETFRKKQSYIFRLHIFPPTPHQVYKDLDRISVTAHTLQNGWKVQRLLCSTVLHFWIDNWHPYQHTNSLLSRSISRTLFGTLLLCEHEN